MSSTTIRKLIEDGQVKRAALFLGQLYELEGPVVDGDKRGRVLGFPTANIFIDPTMLLPSDGVYAVQFILDSQVYQGLANVGANPTFRGEKRRVEVFLLNFSGDLYGEKVRVAFLDKIRHEMVFKSSERLVEQIQQDITAAKRILSLK